MNMQPGINVKAAAITLSVMAFAPCSYAALSNYTQDFEAMGRADPAALADDGWLVFANVLDSDRSTFLYSYGVDPAPNGGAGFSTVTGGRGDTNQGRQQMTVFSDYNNLDHATGQWIETLVFQEQTIGIADSGATLSFSFDAKQGYIAGSSTAQAFIKTLDPNAGFSATNTILFDTTSLGSAWDTYTLSLMIPDDNSLNGQLLQFGFSTFATGYQSSDNYYDNVNASVSAVPVPAAIWLFTSGFAAFAVMARRQRSRTPVLAD